MFTKYKCRLKTGEISPLVLRKGGHEIKAAEGEDRLGNVGVRDIEQHPQQVLEEGHTGSES